MSARPAPKGLHVPHGCSHLIYDHPAGGNCVAEIHIDDSGVGKEICRRWNSHDDLVGALKALLEYTDPCGVTSPKSVWTVARRVLAEASGETK